MIQIIAISIRNFRATGLFCFLSAFSVVGAALATEYETTSLAYCASKWGANADSLALCNENQELAKARYRERLANALDGSFYKQLRACREQEIDATLDQGLNPADLNWFAFEDCFLSETRFEIEALAEEWDGLDRDPARFECAAQTAKHVEEFYRRWGGDIPMRTRYFEGFGDCYYKVLADALGYDTDCDHKDPERLENRSRPCHDLFSVMKREVKRLTRLSEESRAQLREAQALVRRRRCEWGGGTADELAKLCAGVEPKADEAGF